MILAIKRHIKPICMSLLEPMRFTKRLLTWLLIRIAGNAIHKLDIPKTEAFRPVNTGPIIYQEKKAPYPADAQYIY